MEGNYVGYALERKRFAELQPGDRFYSLGDVSEGSPLLLDNLCMTTDHHDPELGVLFVEMSSGGTSYGSPELEVALIDADSAAAVIGSSARPKVRR